MNVEAVPAFGIIEDREPLAVASNLCDAQHYLEFLTQYGYVDRQNPIYLAVPNQELVEMRSLYAEYLEVLPSNSTETYISQSGHVIFFYPDSELNMDQFVRKYSLFRMYYITSANYTYLSLKHKLLIVSEKEFEVVDEVYEDYTLGISDRSSLHFFKVRGDLIKVIDQEGGFSDVLVENEDLGKSLFEAFDTRDNRRRKSFSIIILFSVICLSVFTWRKHGPRYEK